MTEEPDRAHHLLVIHARPLQAEDHRGHAQTLSVARDLLGDADRIAKNEPVARQILEARVEALAGRERLVLLPAPVRTVLLAEERGRLRHRGGRLRRYVALLDQRRLGGRRPPRLAPGGPEKLELARERREGLVRVHQPVVPEPCRPFDAGVAVGGEPDRRPRVLEWPHRDPHAAQAEVAALVGDGLAMPEPFDELQALDQTADALLRVVAERRVFHVAVAEASAEDQAPVRDHIERGELLGDIDGVVQGKQDDAGAKLHAAGLGGDAGQSRDRLEVGERVGEIMLARPHRAEPHGAGEPDLLDVLAEADGLRLLMTVLAGAAEAELHSGSLQTRPDAGSSVSVNCGSAIWSARS